MKRIYPVAFLVALFFTLSSFANIATAQATKPSSSEVAIKNLVENQQYVFYAQTVNPMSGRQQFLTTEYSVKVMKDTVMADLPYFGRAYSAPINPGDGGGIRFTSTKFGYKLTPRKKGGWDISLRPSDTRDVQQMLISIFDNGKANLQVTSTNRQPISFNGYIGAAKPSN